MAELLTYFSQNHDQLLYLVAGVSFIAELTLMGLGGPLLFFAMACFLTAVLISLGLISGWEAEAFSIGISTAVITMLLWKPLKRFQNSGGGADTSSDMIGKQVTTCSEVTSSSGSIRYSGIDWNSRLAEGLQVNIPTDTACKIVGVEGNVMLVAPLQQPH
jgi:membrane protein implicated in regulation of membrane protease activity